MVRTLVSDSRARKDKVSDSDQTRSGVYPLMPLEDVDDEVSRVNKKLIQPITINFGQLTVKGRKKLQKRCKCAMYEELLQAQAF